MERALYRRMLESGSPLACSLSFDEWRIATRAFDESKHPRDDDGKFGSGNGGAESLTPTTGGERKPLNQGASTPEFEEEIRRIVERFPRGADKSTVLAHLRQPGVFPNLTEHEYQQAMASMGFKPEEGLGRLDDDADKAIDKLMKKEKKKKFLGIFG